jgi:hypothetical protein
MRAEDGRDFAAFYDLTNIVEASDTVYFTLSLQLFNFSGADVTGARVVIEGGPNPGSEAPSFLPLDIPYRSSRDLTGNFALPLSGYQTWPEGIPRLVVEFVNGDGNTVKRPIELVRLPLGQ